MNHKSMCRGVRVGIDVGVDGSTRHGTAGRMTPAPLAASLHRER